MHPSHQNSSIATHLRQSLAPAGLALVLAGCRGPLSTLDTAGADAAEIARLFWWMAGGAVLVWTAMIGLTLYCVRATRRPDAQRYAPLLVVGGGAALPTAVLVGVLAMGLPSLPRLVDAPRGGHQAIAVSGEQWWWRVHYTLPDGGRVELANELRLPVGERVEVSLSSGNVIHSFWIPALAGKIDMIPGRTTHLSLEPTRTGTFRGTCAEDRGTAHALMAFPVAVLERDAFDAWLAAEAQPARAPVSPQAQRGMALFEESGCGACHAVRGTAAAGVIGPDLTHVGGRVSLAAATLPNDAAHLTAWLADPARAKPGTHMPAFGMLGQERLQALAAYLLELK